VRDFKRLSKKNCPSVEQRRSTVNEFLSRRHSATKVLNFAELSRSTFYYKEKINIKSSPGRPIPGYSRNKNGTLTPDSWIIEQLKTYRADINFQNGIGCRALHEYLELDFKITVNHKKIYRLCKENRLLLSRKKKIKKFKNVAANIAVTRPNQLWQFDIKYGYIHGENRAFYFLAFVDVFSKKIVSYHIGTNCQKEDLKLTLKMALNHLTEADVEGLIIRSDNGPQMSSNAFRAYVNSLDLAHEFTPIRCPNKNAYIESFFSIFEIEFLQVRYFESLKEVYRQVSEWIYWYNEKRLHASLKYNSPAMFLEKFNSGNLNEFSFSA
jgi:putative transposase